MRIPAWLLPATLVACGGSAVSPKMVEAAKQRWPDSSREGLEAGAALFEKKCSECHKLPDPKSRDAAGWEKVVPKMAKLAGLADADRDRVLRYLIAAREGG